MDCDLAAVPSIPAVPTASTVGTAAAGKTFKTPAELLAPPRVAAVSAIGGIATLATRLAPRHEPRVHDCLCNHCDGRRARPSTTITARSATVRGRSIRRGKQMMSGGVYRAAITVVSVRDHDHGMSRERERVLSGVHDLSREKTYCRACLNLSELHLR